jgi:hypothetical protein
MSRATSAEMQARACFLIAYATEHQPVTVRQLFYAATVANLPGIDKTEDGYNKVQRQVLDLRRAGELPYAAITDATRMMRRPWTFTHVGDALRDLARTYRRTPWCADDDLVEVWVEKSALAGVIETATDRFDVALCPTGGFSSETFAWDAIKRAYNAQRPLVVLALYDFDRSGQDAANSLSATLSRFADQADVTLRYQQIALTVDQVNGMSLPTRPPKRNTIADRRWPYGFAAELDAIPPADLRTLVADALAQYCDPVAVERAEHMTRADRAELLAMGDLS